MISYYIDTKSWSYQQNCLLNPIQSSAFATILFSAIDVFQGAPMERVLRPRSLGAMSSVLLRCYAVFNAKETH